MAWTEVKPNSLHFYVSDVLSWYRFIYTEFSDILNHTTDSSSPLAKQDSKIQGQ